MSVDAVAYVLLVVTIVMTYILITKNRHILLVLGTAALWVSLTAYLLSNTVANRVWQEPFILFVIAIFVSILMFNWLGRKRGDAMDGTINTDFTRSDKHKTVMELDDKEYKSYIRTRRTSRSTRRQR